MNSTLLRPLYDLLEMSQLAVEYRVLCLRTVENSRVGLAVKLIREMKTGIKRCWRSR